MIKINLVAETPAAAAVKTERTPFSLGAKQGDIVLVIMLVLGAIVVGTQWYLLTSERTDLQAIERQRRQERDELLQYIKINVINDLKQQQQGPVRIMDEVSQALPELVWLNKMTLKGRSVVLSGVAMDENAVANYITNINASPYFEEPILKNLARSRSETFSFSLNCTFINSPPKIAAEGAQRTGDGS